MMRALSNRVYVVIYTPANIVVKSVFCKRCERTQVRSIQVITLKMIGELILALGILLISYAIYKYQSINRQYFEERNVKYLGLSFSLYNIYAMIFGRIDVLQFVKRHYDSLPDEP